ncbi:MAG: bifunctional folylpolyglutamate synthase/dihydrofolate synthase, partial [Calditrichia bacterium]|nr:bifunctional folylpolyglutamate synthase/dihydrofolate synthase [Calditrichia bacterium]
MKNIDKTLNELFDLQKFAIKLGLENISKLSRYFNNPHLTYPTIHIAGTNGKGSTAIILQNILMQHGLRVGLFTSPHLVNFNERIRINNEFVENQFILDFWRKVKDFVLELKATFFDTTTCLAFEYFKQNEVDIAIFETGL